MTALEIEIDDELAAETEAAETFATDMTECERLAFRAGWLAAPSWREKERER